MRGAVTQGQAAHIARLHTGCKPETQHQSSTHTPSSLCFQARTLVLCLPQLSLGLAGCLHSHACPALLGGCSAPACPPPPRPPVPGIARASPPAAASVHHLQLCRVGLPLLLLAPAQLLQGAPQRLQLSSCCRLRLCVEVGSLRASGHEGGGVRSGAQAPVKAGAAGTSRRVWQAGACATRGCCWAWSLAVA